MDRDIPYGYCHCGCGERTTIAKETDRRRGMVKGRPMRFISGHNARRPELIEAIRQKRSSINLAYTIGLCQCGCGQEAPLTARNSLKHGWLAGEPVLYIKGHSSRRHPHPEQSPAPIDPSSLKYPYGECQCGCGQDTPLTDRRYITMNTIIEKGAPILYIHGHHATGKFLPPQSEKTCTKCRETKSPDQFEKILSGRRLQSHCKTCRKAEHSIWQKANKDNCRMRDDKSRLKIRYGLSKEDYDAMFKAQNGLCAICGNPETRKRPDGSVCQISIDHCHKTGKIRGLLCRRCNTRIGSFNDDPELLEKAFSYLKESS